MSEEKETIRCPKCGTENSTDDKFCKECGNSLSDNIYKETRTTWKKPPLSFSIVEIIAYFILAAIITFCIFIKLYPLLDNCSFNTSTADNNVFQQIYDLTGNVGFLVEKVGTNLICSLIILFGLITAFAIWSVFKFNRIERRIIETQEMISKKE